MGPVVGVKLAELADRAELADTLASEGFHD